MACSNMRISMLARGNQGTDGVLAVLQWGGSGPHQLSGSGAAAATWPVK